MAYLDNIRTFVRVYELGSMSAAARDLRISAAVASSRISQLEEHLHVRLFQRTTRKLNPTEQGNLFYPGARRILDAVEDAEGEVSSVTKIPRGSIYVAAPLGVGQRLIAPLIPLFREDYPLITVRLRLSDRKLDLAAEGLDVAFILGPLEDSNLRVRNLADCRRVLCAAPEYIARKGSPKNADELKNGTHDCLNLRYPGALEFQWPLQGPDGVRRVAVVGPMESDHGDVLTQWALDGHGIVLKPVFEVADHLTAGRLVEVLPQEPPIPVSLACLYTHRRHQDPKVRLFIDYVVENVQKKVRDQAG